mgnify:CR=1 FL=1
MNPLGPDVATIRTSGCIVFSHGAMAAGGFAGEYERWMDMADLPTEEGREGINCHAVFSELNDLTAEARNKFTEEKNG